MLALLVVVDMLLLVQFGGIDGATLEASILKHWPTIGQPLANHWTTIGQPFANHWPTICQPMRASALCRLDFFLHMVTFCSAFSILQKNCLTQAPVPCNCFFSCKASRPPCNKCVFIIACELCHFRALLHSANSARALIASTLLIKSAIDRFRSSFGLQRANSA